MATLIIVFQLAARIFFLHSNLEPELHARYSETINVDDLYSHVAILASDSLEGRETGEIGQKMAAEYIRQQFIKEGLLPVVKEQGEASYYQKFNLIRSSWADVYVKINNQKFQNFDGIIRYGKKIVPSEVASEVIFAGGGSEAEIDAVNVQGKAVLILSLEPYTWAKKTEYARSKGATAFFVVNTPSDSAFDAQAENLRHYLTEPKVAFAPQQSGESVVFYTSPQMAGKIFNTQFEKLQNLIVEAGKTKNYSYKLKPGKIAYKANMEFEELETENVLGFVEGGDKKEEILVITAHYDHIGKNGHEIFNGADDDASGTAAVIELAQAFSMAKKDGNTPRRSILFMLVTGEEKGLLGSQYYTNNPVFPLKNTIANLNIDMIGRLDETYADDPNYVYLIGSDKLSQELHDLSEEMNNSFTNLKLDYRYNDDKDPNRFYYRSDHYNFAKHNIPVIFYFNGTHEDYHKSTDTIEKLNFEKMEKITRLIFHTAWELANRPERVALKTKIRN